MLKHYMSVIPEAPIAVAHIDFKPAIISITMATSGNHSCFDNDEFHITLS